MKRIAAIVLALMLVSLSGYAEDIDVDINSNEFMTTLHDFLHEFDGEKFMTVRITGYVHRYAPDEAHFVNFAVLRDYFSEESGVIPYGLDCYYEGDLPEDDDWVTVVGHPFYYEEEDTIFVALMAQQVDVLPDDMRESKLVFD